MVLFKSVPVGLLTSLGMVLIVRMVTIFEDNDYGDHDRVGTCPRNSDILTDCDYPRKDNGSETLN